MNSHAEDINVLNGDGLGDDATNNTNRFMNSHAEDINVLNGDGLALQTFVGPTSKIPKMLDRQSNVNISSNANWFAIIERLNFSKTLLVLLQEISKLKQQITSCTT